MKAIEFFLSHHKRGCPAIQGRECNCGLFQARRQLDDMRALVEAAQEFRVAVSEFNRNALVSEEVFVQRVRVYRSSGEKLDAALKKVTG